MRFAIVTLQTRGDKQRPNQDLDPEGERRYRAADEQRVNEHALMTGVYFTFRLMQWKTTATSPCQGSAGSSFRQ